MPLGNMSEEVLRKALEHSRLEHSPITGSARGTN